MNPLLGILGQRPEVMILAHVRTQERYGAFSMKAVRDWAAVPTDRKTVGPSACQQPLQIQSNT